MGCLFVLDLGLDNSVIDFGFKTCQHTCLVEWERVSAFIRILLAWIDVAKLDAGDGLRATDLGSDIDFGEGHQDFALVLLLSVEEVLATAFAILARDWGVDLVLLFCGVFYHPENYDLFLLFG